MNFSRLPTILPSLVHILYMKMRYRAHIHIPLKQVWNLCIGSHFKMVQNNSRHTTLALYVTPPSRFDSNVIIIGSGTVSLGSFIVVGRNCVFECNERIEIGNDVMIAENVSIRDTDHSFSDITRPMRMQGITTAPVKIGNDVWIGFGAVITKGVEVGKGCVIGANSVVTHDIPPYSIAAGVPAKVIKQRV